MKAFLKFSGLVIVAVSLSAAEAATQKLCGQPVTYKETRPSRNTARALSVYSGIWVGVVKVNSEYAPCVAFVIEEVSSNGRVKVQQAWGPHHESAGSWPISPNAPKGATKESWGGQITNGSIVLYAQKVSYQLTVNENNPTLMTGKEIYANGDTLEVELKLQQGFAPQ